MGKEAVRVAVGDAAALVNPNHCGKTITDSSRKNSTLTN